MMGPTPLLPQAAELFHKGIVAMAEAELRGIPVDVPYCHHALAGIQIKIKELQAICMEDEFCQSWQGAFGREFNLNANDQLAHMLFVVKKFPSEKKTKGGSKAVDDEVLEDLCPQLPVLETLLEMRKWLKVSGTYLEGILRATHQGICHPSFDLHTTRTYRSSSSNPNFQNMPIRDPECGEIIRSAFLPPPGFQMVESDYSQLEVRVNASYSGDSHLIRYILDKSTDMHRDSAMDLFLLPASEVTKEIRHEAKNKNVFAKFYGSVPQNIARALWRQMTKPDGLRMKDGRKLLDHLKSKGYDHLSPQFRGDPNAYETLVQKEDQIFWFDRLSEHREWKERWVRGYTQRGYFDSLTGFRYFSVMYPRDVVCYPVQGSAFHCCLRSFYRLAEEMKRRGMKSYLVAQIHDSILAMVAEGELKQFIELAQEIMISEIGRTWTWLKVPLDVEFEVAPPGESWFKKKKFKAA